MHQVSIREYIHPIQNLNKLTVDGILLIKPDTSIEFQNQVFSRMCGYSSLQLKGRKMDFIFKFENQKELLKRLQTEKVIATDLVLKSGNNKTSKIRALFSLMELEEEPVGMMVIIPNKMPRDDVNRYQLIKNPVLRAINIRRDYVWIVADSQSGHYLFCSDSIKEITGWRVEDFTSGGRAFVFSIFHPDDREASFNSIAEWYLKTNQKKIIYDHLPLVIQFKLKKKSGDWCELVGEANVLERDPGGEVTLILWSFRKERTGTLSTERQSHVDNIQDYVKFIDGKPFIDLEFLRLLQSKKAIRIAEKKTDGERFGLTERELQILRLISEGLSSEEIGEKIFISKHTVNLHRKQMMKKIGARNLAELIRISMQSGLL